MKKAVKIGGAVLATGGTVWFVYSLMRTTENWRAGGRGVWVGFYGPAFGG